MLFFIVLLIIVIAIVVTNAEIVPQQTCRIVERLGKYHSTWEAGFHVKVPFIDRKLKPISLKERVYDFPPQDVITKDNVSMTIDSVVYASVFDPQKYTYGIDNPTLGLQNLAATTLRSIIGAMELDSTLSSRADINRQMREVLDEATDPWGIKVSRVEVKNIKPPEEIEEVMTKQMRAERERRQTVLEAQAHKESVVSRAEGDKQAKLLAAEAERDAQIALAQGRAESIRLVYEAEAQGIEKLAGAGINDEVIRLKSIEALRDVSNGRATKIFIPNDLTNTIGLSGVAGESFREFSPNAEKEIKEEKIKKEKQVQNMLSKDACLDEGSSMTTKNAARTNAQMETDMIPLQNKLLEIEKRKQ